MTYTSVDPDVIERQRLKRMEPKELHLGRYPFKAGIDYYIAKKGTKYSPSTIAENTRKLHYFASVFQDLKDKGLVASTDPRKINKYDIESFIDRLKEEGLEMSTKMKYINVLESYLVIFSNNVIKEMKHTEDWPLMKTVDGNPTAISQTDLQQIFDSIELMKEDTMIQRWHKIVIIGVISLMFGTACRPKEIFNAKLKDITTDSEGRRLFFVEHPKGENTWGKKEWIPIIRGDMVKKFDEFLVKRAQFLRENKKTSAYLFPNPVTGAPYTGKAIRKIKSELEEVSGISFKLKDFRSTYVTLTAGKNVDRLNNVSVQLRHKSVKTTEGFYLQLIRTEAQDSIKDAWKETEID